MYYLWTRKRMSYFRKRAEIYTPSINFRPVELVLLLLFFCLILFQHLKSSVEIANCMFQTQKTRAHISSHSRKQNNHPRMSPFNVIRSSSLILSSGMSFMFAVMTLYKYLHNNTAKNIRCYIDYYVVMCIANNIDLIRSNNSIVSKFILKCYIK